MELLLNFGLLILLAAVAVGVIGMRNLFGLVVLLSGYSFIMATLLVAMDAADVGMTEAAVGAGVSTVLLLSTLHLVRTEEAPGRVFHPLAAALALITGTALLFGESQLPAYGDGTGPIHHHVAPYYIENSKTEIGVSNVITAVLASYRGYDTLGEITVIFTAGLGIMLLLHGRRRKPDVSNEVRDDDGKGNSP